jgi:hypothetical protein
MAHLNSAGKPLRPLLNRRERIGEQPLTEQKAPSAGKSAQPERNDLPPVEDGQSHLQAQIPLEEKADPLTLSGDFLDATAIEAFGKEAIDHNEIADLHPYVHFVPDNEGNLNSHLMGMADKRVHQSRQLTVKAEPDLGPDVRLVEHSRTTAGGDSEKVHMACADKQPQRPASVVKAEAADHPMGEIVDQLYKEKEAAAKKTDATPTATLQQPAANAGPAQPQTGPVTESPDTRNDHKIALQMQVDESLADFEFWKDIEARLKAITDKYCKDDDPKDKTRALYEDTKQFVQDLGKRYSHFQQDYDQRYVKADPMQGEVQNLSKLGQGNTAEPFVPTGTGQPQSGLKESKFDLKRQSQTAQRLRQQTQELEDTIAGNERRKRLERADSNQQFIEFPDEKQAEKPPLVIKTYDSDDE